MDILKHYFLIYWPTAVALFFAVYKWTKTDLALAISQADKNNDGTLEDSELEDLAVCLVKNANNPALKLLPESIIRYLVQKLCAKRNKLFKIKDTNLLVTDQTACADEVKEN